MYPKLKINQRLVSWEQMETAWRLNFQGPRSKKFTALRALYFRFDGGARRKDFAQMIGVSPRTINRWINDFNQGGFWSSPPSFWAKKGRKRLVDRKVFWEETLPQLEQALAAVKTIMSR